MLKTDLHAPSPAPPALAQQAIQALAKAAMVQPGDTTKLVEERNVWQPNSWLIQRCWEVLVDAGAGEEALQVARLAQMRHPLAPLQALHRIAQQVAQRPQLAQLVRLELERIASALFYAPNTLEGNALERLLLVAASAGQIDDLPLACACLEAIDQTPKAWERVFVRNEWRTLLAESIAHIGVHPLTLALVANAVRRFDDAGAQFLHQTAIIMAQLGEAAPRRVKRLLLRTLETFRYAPLTSLHSRRLAAIAFGHAGLVEDVLAQLTTIANIQDARRETGFSLYKEDPLLLRQVKRPAANAEVDFQVYTLQQALKALPMRQLSREQRITLADQLAALGMRSDGWTAAGAAVTLIELGAFKYAVEVVHKIAAHDPTRSEGMLSLVRGLLAVDEAQLAYEQARHALNWARAQHNRNPERAITWGLAQIYLERGEPDKALQLLELWRAPVGWRYRLQAWLGRGFDDDTLRLRALRWRALLQRGGVHGNAADLRAYTQELRTLYNELRTWATRLLDGEALVNFYIDALFQPLLAAGKGQQAWELLPELIKLLNTTTGDKLAAHVATIVRLLLHQLRLATAHQPINPANTSAPPISGNGSSSPGPSELHETIISFLVNLWQSSAQRGTWQVIHSLEGALPLLVTLAGPQTLVTIAHTVSQRATR